MRQREANLTITDPTQESAGVRLIAALELNQLLKDLLNSTRDFAIVAVALDGAILLWNTGAATLYGYTADELIGKKSINFLFPEEDRAAHIPELLLEKAAREGKSQAISRRFTKDGQEIAVELTVTARHDELEQINGFLLIGQNITEYLRAQQLMEKASHLRNEFLASMSHELRTPLNSIIGFSELLVGEGPGPINTLQKEYLHDVISSAHHLLKLISDILDIAKIEAGKMVLNNEVFSLPRLLNEAIATMKPLVAPKKLLLTCESEIGLDEVEMDQQKLKQILFNLLSNAIKFTPEGGLIAVKATRAPNQVVMIKVRDNGIGINSEKLNRLFLEFEQINLNASSPYRGTGLGLTITKKLVAVMGGIISAISAEGEGSTFTVTLPMKASPLRST